MHAFLIVGTDRNRVSEEIAKLSKTLKVKTLEFPLAKIDDARNLKSFVNLALSTPTAIIINSIEEATLEAANAFLKNLEEPQKDLYFVLTSRSIHKVLPTIVSRCQVVRLKNEGRASSNKEVEKFLAMNTGEKLAFLDQIRDREEAKTFVHSLILTLHEELHTKSSGLSQKADNLEAAQKTLEALEANGNVTLQLANLVVNLKD